MAKDATNDPAGDDLDEVELLGDDVGDGDKDTTLTKAVEFRVRPVRVGRRLDQFLAARFSDRSRAFFQRLIKSGHVLVNGQMVKASTEMARGDIVHIDLPPPPKRDIEPENIPLDVLYEDDYFVVINKAPNMVVHPARGNWGGTLVNALAFHFEKLSGVNGPERPGILHRLDRDTTGVIVVAKSDIVHAQIARQWENRRVRKEYFALVEGTSQCDADAVNRTIGRHPKVREKMAVDVAGGKEAYTTYEITERFKGFAAVTARPKTGRTHQIRVHLASVGLRVLADAMYSSRSRFTLADITGRPEDTDTVLLERQALHARRLTLWHPITGKQMTFEAPVPEDMQRTLRYLQRLAT